MTKQSTLGITQRELARRWNVRHSYVQKLIVKGVLPVMADGTLHQEECDRARARYTIPRRRRYQPSNEPNVRACAGCGGIFSNATAREANSPNPAYCSDDCANDIAAGRSRAEIQRRIRKELAAIGCSRKELADANIFDWVSPQPSPPCACTPEEFAAARVSVAAVDRFS
jgi:hypothetical protein